MLEFTLAIKEQDFTALQSKDLKVNLKKMLSAMSGMNKSQWQYAVALHNIVVNEYYKPDFDSVSNFAKAIGLDKSSVSRYVSAVRAMVNDITPLTGLTMNDLPYSKANRIGTVKDVKDFLQVSKIDLLSCTVRELEKAIKDYKASLEKAVEPAKDEPAKDEPAKDEPAKDETPAFTGRYDSEKVWFEINGIQYIISIDRLAEFKVED